MTSIMVLSSHLGAIFLLSILYLGWVLGILSRRMGEVTKMRSYYKAYYLGNALIAIGLLSYLLQSNAALSGRPQVLLGEHFSLLAFHLPLFLGVSINLITALIYWSWLAREQ